MKGSRTIQVVKADRSVERFDSLKLTGAMWRAMEETGGSFDNARRLAGAIETYLRRRNRRRVSSATVFDMTVKAFRYVGLPAAAETAEAYRNWRNVLRKQLRIRYEQGRLTFWDKSWLCEFACRSWHVSRGTARFFAGKIELMLLRGDEAIVDRQAVVAMLNRMVLEYGLADAVPVEL
jgi:hypothetical protein